MNVKNAFLVLNRCAVGLVFQVKKFEKSTIDNYWVKEEFALFFMKFSFFRECEQLKGFKFKTETLEDIGRISLIITPLRQHLT